MEGQRSIVWAALDDQALAIAFASTYSAWLRAVEEDDRPTVAMLVAELEEIMDERLSRDEEWSKP